MLYQVEKISIGSSLCKIPTQAPTDHILPQCWIAFEVCELNLNLYNPSIIYRTQVGEVSALLDRRWWWYHVSPATREKVKEDCRNDRIPDLSCNPYHNITSQSALVEKRAYC